MTLSQFSEFPAALKALVRYDTPTMAYVLKISDADTITVIQDRKYYDSSVMRLRLRGINAAELNTAEGVRARAFLVKLLPIGSPVVVTTYKQSFDRYVSDVLFLEDGKVKDLATEIVVAGHAVRVK